MPSLSREERRLLAKYNKDWPTTMVQVPKADWPEFQPESLREVWRSRYFLAQVHQESHNMLRVSVCRTTHNGDSWEPGIQWDELMEVKRQMGLGWRDALEVYPDDRCTVNVANMRHLWLPPEPIPWKWGNKR